MDGMYVVKTSGTESRSKESAVWVFFESISVDLIVRGDAPRREEGT